MPGIFFARLLSALVGLSLLSACSDNPDKNFRVSADLKDYPRAVWLRQAAQSNKPHTEPYLNGSPAHVLMLLNGAGQAGESSEQPQIYVFPLKGLQASFSGAERTEVDRQIHQLRRIIERGDTRRDTTPIPVFPAQNGAQQFHTRLQAVHSAGVDGIRFITRHTQNLGPVSNRGLMYSFQGFSKDGDFYISALLPLQLQGLPETHFVDESVNFIDAAEGRAFSPSLEQYDALVGSLRVTEP